MSIIRSVWCIKTQHSSAAAHSEHRRSSGCRICHIAYSSLGAAATLRRLHWLPIEWRIRHKIATLAFKARSAAAPNYLCNLVSAYAPSRSLRSSVANLLTVPSHKLTFGSRAFRVATPTIWNSLPEDIRSSDSLAIFRRRLKTHFFNRAFT